MWQWPGVIHDRTKAANIDPAAALITPDMAVSSPLTRTAKPFVKMPAAQKIRRRYPVEATRQQSRQARLARASEKSPVDILQVKNRQQHRKLRITHFKEIFE